MDAIYKDFILDHYKKPRNFGRIEKPSVSARLSNSACGDIINIDLMVRNNLVQEVKFNGEGCAVSIASASIIYETVIGKNIRDINKLTAKDVLGLIKINLSPSRVKCALLPLEVLQKATHLLQ